MQTIESFLKDSITSEITPDKISTLKPACFRFWKTYDGLDLNSRKIIQEIFYEIESLKEKNHLVVKRISFIGYSLGGLISRYVIGLLNEIGFFEQVEPVFFTTFATPHLGIEFFKKNVFDGIANHVGPYLFGKSGGQLFLADHEKLLVQLADPDKKFLQGLSKFKRHILLANVKNDRTVAFYTSFITSYSPFEDLDKVKIKYLKKLPHTRIAGKLVRPKFIDLNRSHVVPLHESRLFKGNIQEETPLIRKNKYLKILVIILLTSLFVPVWIPFIFSTSITVSIYSFVKVKIHKLPNVKHHWKRVLEYVYENSPIDPEDLKASRKSREKRSQVENHESFKGDTSHITEGTMEGMLYAEERFADRNKSQDSRANEEEEEEEEEEDDDDEDDEDDEDVDADADDSSSFSGRVSVPESQLEGQENGDFKVGNSMGPKMKKDILSGKKISTSKLVDMDYELNDKVIVEHIPTLENYTDSKLFEKRVELPLSNDKRYMMENLNKIKWIKVPVFLDVWNAHDGIVSRRGPKTNPKGAATIGLWVSVLRTYMQGEDKYRDNDSTLVDVS
ncbi:uncharacterized protein LODBEIA_P51140 [Lodderomyces beijingensis]|uniref:DUF676 domain-containing protein n=1 Tax=Lodderomyces beijingensis TaxID=1775926 RepID=A0ABP0ZW59_9ASCO